ncbi:unnamed protein product [Parnassius apollo]|uniref:(apollo) hypothetical protein n=1 Tax=Parnassius apollo TaxID=110799 RepID=A0A8S3XCA4_PARAO|nr:unnamed protein product [Parnassius apollo]
MEQEQRKYKRIIYSSSENKDSDNENLDNADIEPLNSEYPSGKNSALNNEETKYDSDQEPVVSELEPDILIALVHKFRANIMIEEEYDDELPPIIVNSRSNNSSEFTMPSADIIASQRAREEECERELRLLRELHACNDQKPDIVTQVDTRMIHSDSSGSEGEGALAAAVDALRVQPMNNTSLPVTVDLIDFISQLIEQLPEYDTQFLQDYLKVLQQGNPTITQHVTNEVLSGIEAALQSEQSVWAGGGVVCCGAWLCGASLRAASAPAASPRAPALRTRRALHALLQHATDQQVDELGRIMSVTLRTPQLLLELSDAVQGAPGAPRNLATQLLKSALEKEKSLGVRYTLVQLAGRAAACGERRAAAELRDALAAAPRPHHNPDHLKVAVGASKLELLFRAKDTLMDR